jgi:glc operon protein GlcG
MSVVLRAAAVAAVLLAAPGALRAQLVDQKVLSQEGARRALAAAETEARRNGWRVSIAVVDATGELMAFTRMDDAAVTSVAISQGKARTAARFRRPTRALDSSLTAGRTALLAFEGIMPVEGGVPIVVGGRVVGGVGVSGVTSQQDAVAAQAGAGAVGP